MIHVLADPAPAILLHLHADTQSVTVLLPALERQRSQEHHGYCNGTSRDVKNLLAHCAFRFNGSGGPAEAKASCRANGSIAAVYDSSERVNIHVTVTFELRRHPGALVVAHYTFIASFCTLRRPRYRDVHLQSPENLSTWRYYRYESRLT